MVPRRADDRAVGTGPRTSGPGRGRKGTHPLTLRPGGGRKDHGRKKKQPQSEVIEELIREEYGKG